MCYLLFEHFLLSSNTQGVNHCLVRDEGQVDCDCPQLLHPGCSLLHSVVMLSTGLAVTVSLPLSLAAYLDAVRAKVGEVVSFVHCDYPMA